ncbi:MAG TPA: ATP-dependent RecD-like DNA helicase [Cerasibacillus sp.]|uniref:SF1B family DNA helicase RecD2 n=1 Tax=Cerasibacillus sp. TaxID=2498711 RepID=UPI002F408F1F
MLEEQVSEQQLYMKGEPLFTIFHNETEQFSIVKIRIIETNTSFEESEIVIKGYFAHLHEGTSYLFYGELESHIKYGTQFAVHSYQTFIPDTKEGLISYLSSDLFYGVGKRIATRIVNKLGERAIEKIIQSPHVLNDIKGLKSETAKNIVESLKENQGFEQVAIYLAKYQVGMKLAQKIYQQYKDEAIEIISSDPYQLVFDIDGFGFMTADSIARKNGLTYDHPSRIGAGCIYILQQSAQNGHVYLPTDLCVKQVLRLLTTANRRLTAEEVLDRLFELNTKKHLIIQDERVYLPVLYYAEDGVASHLKRLLDYPIEDETPKAELLKIIGKIEEEEVLSYGKEQFEAIEQALHSKVMILTGGPGTGKTTVIKGIIKAFAMIHDLSIDLSSYDDQADYPFILTAPTGRAAKRLTESTGLPAGTIHRLLGWDGDDSFEKDESKPLSGKLLIVDEFSMVDIWLANWLFKAIPNDMQVLLVGDEDQLPSVGPGQVLSDLLEDQALPFVTLTDVYRQKEGSKIIQLAHLIKRDRLQVSDLNKDRDFSFISCHENQVVQVISSIIQKALEKGIDMRDIQILAPMYRTDAGIMSINRAIQQLVNPKTNRKREVKMNDVTYRVGDKVIQLVNQPEEGVFNGDIGEVVAIFKEDENVDNKEQLVVSFDEREVVYERKDYMNIMHAFCISIHKSQGSEFPIVIMPVVSGYRRMLRKNLIYTALTRAKRSLIICGDKHAFLSGVETLDTNKRYTSLKDKLNKLQIEVNNEKDEELSPYDFMD